ncbi:AMP-binding protein, partial [Streptomyces sp. LBUM 1485]|nr:AMP-binding protein [Streptomyces sp. LBUM 1485]
RFRHRRTPWTPVHPGGPTPSDAVAIQDARGELSFAKAELRATQLASVLIHAGVQLGDPVIIHCDDHQQALVAQLAVLKAGGVCVPAAHGHNRAQLRAIASISGASTVLCSRSTRGAWPRRFAALPLDDQGTTRLAAAHRRESALPLSHPREAAYLMLSGGGPDGPVGYLTDHRAWRLATAQRIRAAGPAPHRVFVAGPPADPRAVSAMWWAFACGGSLRALPDTGAPVARDGMLCAAVFSPEEYDAVVATLPSGHGSCSSSAARCRMHWSPGTSRHCRVRGCAPISPPSTARCPGPPERSGRRATRSRRAHSAPRCRTSGRASWTAMAALRRWATKVSCAAPVTRSPSTPSAAPASRRRPGRRPRCCAPEYRCAVRRTAASDWPDRPDEGRLPRPPGRPV